MVELEGLELKDSSLNPLHLDDKNIYHDNSLSISFLARLGEPLVSLCQQPGSCRMTAVVLKARNLPRMDLAGLSGKQLQLVKYLSFMLQTRMSRYICYITTSG